MHPAFSSNSSASYDRSFAVLSQDLCAAALAKAEQISDTASPSVLTVENVPPRAIHRTPSNSPPAADRRPASAASNKSPRASGKFSAPRRSPTGVVRELARGRPSAQAHSPLRAQHTPSVHYSESTGHSRLSSSHTLPLHSPLESVLSTVQELSHEPAEALEAFGEEWGGAQEHDQEHGEWHDDDETDAGSRVYETFRASHDSVFEAASPPPRPSRQEQSFAWSAQGTHSAAPGPLRASLKEAEARAFAEEQSCLSQLAGLAGASAGRRTVGSRVPKLHAQPEELPTTPPHQSVISATQAVRSFTGRQVAEMRKLQQQRTAERRRREEAEEAQRRAEEAAAAKRRAEEAAKRKAAEDAAAAEAAAAAKAVAAAAPPNPATAPSAVPSASAGAPPKAGISMEEFDLAGATVEFEALRKEADKLFGDERDEHSAFEELFETAERAAGSFVSTDEGVAKACTGFLQTIQAIPSVCPADAGLQQRLKLTLLADFAQMQVHRHCRQAVAANIFSQFAMDESRTKLLLRISDHHPEMLKFLMGAVCQVVPELIGRPRAPRDMRIAPVTKSGAVNDMIEVAASLCLLADCCCFADQSKQQGQQLINTMWALLVRFVREPASLKDAMPLSIVVAWCAWSRCGPALSQRFPVSAPKLWAAIRTKLSPAAMSSLLGNRATQCRLYIDAVAAKLQLDASTGYKCRSDRYHEVAN